MHFKQDELDSNLRDLKLPSNNILFSKINHSNLVDLTSIYDNNNRSKINRIIHNYDDQNQDKQDDFNEEISVNMPMILNKGFSFEKNQNLINNREDLSNNNFEIIKKLMKIDKRPADQNISKSRTEIFSNLEKPKMMPLNELNDILSHDITFKNKGNPYLTMNNHQPLYLTKTRSENNSKTLPPQKHSEESDRIKKVPCIKIEKEEYVKENTDFQIFSYLISDLYKSEESDKNLQFPIVPKKKSENTFGPRLGKSNINIEKNRKDAEFDKNNTKRIGETFQSVSSNNINKSPISSFNIDESPFNKNNERKSTYYSTIKEKKKIFDYKENEENLFLSKNQFSANFKGIKMDYFDPSVQRKLFGNEDKSTILKETTNIKKIKSSIVNFNTKILKVIFFQFRLKVLIEIMIIGRKYSIKKNNFNICAVTVYFISCYY